LTVSRPPLLRPLADHGKGGIAAEASSLNMLIGLFAGYVAAFGTQNSAAIQVQLTNGS